MGGADEGSGLMAPVAEDDGLCWWCCDCDCEDDGECPHPLKRCPHCIQDEDPLAWDDWDGDDEDE
ncbi:MAG: hypothetical protein KJ067_23305 [Vicinamibacteria bacterium]|nr:hypothetical protein [Vicinamibacteria bacterium]MCL4822066.1 hypothetical protein [Vicinamibacteria bacterium]